MLLIKTKSFSTRVNFDTCQTDEMYFFRLILLYLYMNKSSGTIVESGDRPVSMNSCQPGCTNTSPPECNKFEIELRAAVVSCESRSPFAPSTPLPTSQEGHDDGPGVEIGSKTLQCGKKLRATLKVTNIGETATYNQYIIIDHVIDPTNGQRVSLLNPYVVVLRQKPLLQLYGLKYKYMVNAEAKEEVINKRSPGFTGCNDALGHSTCGSVRYNGVSVPFSQGFCCSCDEEVNIKRQPRNIVNSGQNNTKGKDHSPRIIRPPTEVFRKIRDTKIFKVSPHFIPRQSQYIFNNEDSLEEDSLEDYYDTNQARNIWKDERKVQKRGGQVCDDKRLPKRADPSTYHDSAHCLRYSKLWYSVYQLSDPILEHSVYLRVYQKRERQDGSACWLDLTAGVTINIGTFHPKYQDRVPVVVATYETVQGTDEDIQYALDAKTKRLLVPQEVAQAELDKHPEVLGGPQEYLVVDQSQLKASGEQCDSVGVGYPAFYNQPQRCSRPKGSCLKNQPRHMWKRDKHRCNQGLRGKYLLKNFARVPEDALRKTKKGDTKYLALYYGEKHRSSIDLEITADDNIVFKSNPLAKITETYIDSTSDTTTMLTIKIFNAGLVSNQFHPRLADCPLEIPSDWGNLEGNPAVIPPQHVATFTLRLLGILPAKNFYCSIEALDVKNEIVAVRRIRIIKGDRCICSWHCLCACLETTGLGCVPLAMDHYRAAGFIGSMPLTSNMIQAGSLQNVLFGCFFFMMLIVVIFLLLGITKALIGLLCSVPVGIWGLDILVSTRMLRKYLEPDLEERSMVFDEENWPVHPDTLQRTVRIVDVRVEFCLNVIFFFTYPLMMMCILCRKLCCDCYLVPDDMDSDYKFDAVSTVLYAKYDSGESKTITDTDSEDMFDFMENATRCSGED
ncbi:hypothetical protein CBL_08284 [Carabus blaptoides fortunei]